jgi:hypothetical protein
MAIINKLISVSKEQNNVKRLSPNDILVSKEYVTQELPSNFPCLQN